MTCYEDLISHSPIPRDVGAYLKETLQPPDLKYTFAQKHAQLKDAPPLHSTIRTLRRVPVRSLTYHDVGLLIFDLVEEFGELLHCFRRSRQLAFFNAPLPGPPKQQRSCPFTTILGYGQTNLQPPEDPLGPRFPARILSHAR